MNPWTTILVVDDEKNTRDGLKEFLSGAGYDVNVAENAVSALELIKKDPPEIVLTDLKMPDRDGLDLLHEIKRRFPATIVILLTAYGTVENAVQAMKAGAYYYITKPVHFDELDLILKKALNQRTIEQENIDLRAELIRQRHEAGKFIGKSQEIQQLILLAKQVAKTNSTVLLEGESGTGKELIAHLIHQASERAEKPFVPVHMSALTDTLLASELFGHERGAFTGATERRIGRFERADGGTLFLDEVSEIPPTMQTKLLRVLQSGQFERVGSSKTLQVNVRLICATNKNLQEEVAKGKFREDLYYRINVILLKIPPLREHRGDIPLLANYYLKHFAEINRKAITSISSEAMEILKSYSWPGNVRELKNIMERTVVLATGNIIDAAQLPEDLRHSNLKAQNQNIAAVPSGSNLQEMEQNMIRQVLVDTKNNKSLAAKKLGISRRTLYRKLEEYKISD